MPANARRFVICSVLTFMVTKTTVLAQQDDALKLNPTRANASYGPHDRNVLDFWAAESESPTPLVIYIHGGGFRGGSKESLNVRTLRGLLAAGISVATVNYRLTGQAPLPAAHEDCRRMIQFVRSQAETWNIDKSRIGAFGGSAGAQLCMWLAFHDEMAMPDSSDPIERESTRLACVATNGGQTTMDFAWWREWIPGYDRPHRPPSDYFGDVDDAARQRIVEDISALSLISADDPPIYMRYGMAPDDPVPSDAARAQGWKVHHVVFGVKLKEAMDELRVQADLNYPGADARYRSDVEFFRARLIETDDNDSSRSGQ